MPKASNTMVSLFAGIGGFELGFKQRGIATSLMCEIDPLAKSVLQKRFPHTPLVDDVRDIDKLPNGTTVLCAGFPCQDLSSIGDKEGIEGSRSSLVKEVFRILKYNPTEWVIFENVSFMLSLHKGEAIRTIVNELERLGYNWAYRTIDSLTFLPQHRRRVYVVASLHYDPRDVLLSGNSRIQPKAIDYDAFSSPVGFYWTEGKNALGLVSDGIPTLKSGSTIGIASPPAIVFPNGEIGCPDIRDAERLQGFPDNWTAPAEIVSKRSSRWKLVGNAVTVNVVSWIARKLLAPKPYISTDDVLLQNNSKWPNAAWGINGERHSSSASLYPETRHKKELSEFLRYPIVPLSHKAASGFWERLSNGTMRCPLYFREAIENYVNH